MPVSRILVAAAITALLVSCAPPIKTSTSCKPNPGETDHCAVLVGCIGTEGEFFVSEATGWASGSLSVRTSKGATCEGRWGLNKGGKSGTTQFTCSDQRKGWVRFQPEGNDLATVVGNGRMLNGAQRITAFSGTLIRPEWRDGSNRVDMTRFCSGPKG